MVALACFSVVACDEDTTENSENAGGSSEVVSDTTLDVELKDMDIESYITLADYKDIQAEVTLEEVSEEDVREQMEYSFEMQVSSAVGVTDRAIVNGDIVNIDFVGYLDGVAFEGGTGADYDLEIGSGAFVPGFEEGLIDAMPGTTVEVPLTFPTNYHEELAGKDVVFEVTVNYIFPEITDETVAGLGNSDYATVAELEAFARNLVQKDVDEYNYDLVVRIATAKIVNESTFHEIPEELIAQQRAIVEKQISSNVAGYGLDVETYLSMVYGSTLEEVATENVKERIVIQAIANAEGIEITDEHLDAELTYMALNYGLASNDQILELMGTDRAYYREYMLGMQIYKLIYENTTVVKPAE